MLLLWKVAIMDPDNLKNYDSCFLAGVSYSMTLHLPVACQHNNYYILLCAVLV